MQIQDGSVSGKLADWAIATISAMPPSQNVIAFLIILLLALPIIRAGIREFRAERRPPDPMIQQTPWLITTLNKIDLQTQEAQRDIDAIERALGQIHRDLSAVGEAVAAITRLLRARKSRGKP